MTSMEIYLDPGLRGVLPREGKVVRVSPAGDSDYCQTLHVELQFSDGKIQDFFVKESPGPFGFELTRAHYISDSEMEQFIPDHMPAPLYSGTYTQRPDVHFFLARYVSFDAKKVPGPEHYTEALAKLHLRSEGRQAQNHGYFGFPVNNHVANCEQVNTWNRSWEHFFAEQMRHHFEYEESLRGKYNDELRLLKELFFEKVIPRYLRPLQSNRRKLVPVLLHGDLWPGNVHYLKGSKRAMIFDSVSFWGHHELDVAVLRNPKYKLGDAYVEAYFKLVPPSEPRHDVDSRGLVYLVRNQLVLSAMEYGCREPLVEALRTIVGRVLEEEGMCLDIGASDTLTMNIKIDQ